MEKEEPKMTVCKFASLWKALHKCTRNVGWKDSVASYANHSLVGAYKIKCSLDEGTYRLSPYAVFYVHEPKERRITSTKFKDRVVQRSLCDNYLYDAICANFVEENCACQKKKGTDYARKTLVREMKAFHKENGLDGWILKCDIKDFFGSTSHETAKKAVSDRAKDPWAVGMVNDIIDSFGDVGIGLGSQVSQLIQLAVLDGLDHFIKEELGIKHYVRYMDDFILIDKSKRKLELCLNAIRQRVAEIGLRLSEKKTRIQKVSQPIRFLGFSFMLWDTSKVTWRLPDENLRNERRRLKCLVRRASMGALTKADVDECYQSWRAHAKKSDSRGKILKMDKYYKNLWRTTL